MTAAERLQVAADEVLSEYIYPRSPLLAVAAGIVLDLALHIPLAVAHHAETAVRKKLRPDPAKRPGSHINK